MDLTAPLGPLQLRTPLIAAAGTVASVVEWVPVGCPEAFGAAVAKSVSVRPWPGNPGLRLLPLGPGMLNTVGIHNPGLSRWQADIGPRLGAAPVPVWGSAVGRTPDEFAVVAAGLEEAGVEVVEVNLSCPNLGDDEMFALSAAAAGPVVHAVRQAVTVPVGAKLSPEAADIVDVAGAVAEAGADFVVLTNTARGAGWTVSGGGSAELKSGGCSGPPLKSVGLHCVSQVRRAMASLPIVGCGGVSTGRDVADYLRAGAGAVAVGTANLAAPRAGARILNEFVRWCHRHRVQAVCDLAGA